MNAFLEGGGAYVLTFVFGASVGLSVAYADRWPQTVANVGIILVFIPVAIPASAIWPWMVPLFVAAAILTSVTVAGARLGEHPMLEGVGFWRRSAMWILHSKRLKETGPVDR
jgi:hypothetical protein